MESAESNREAVLPLTGVRVLAAEQMQSLPYATQLLASLGAEIVKVEHPTRGDLGRSSLPSTIDTEGNPVGATFLRNNLYKKSIALDLKNELGQDLFRRLAKNFDIVAENFKPGTMEKFGLSYKDFRESQPELIYLSISGFGNTVESPYSSWPAFAPIAEAMSGIYNFNRNEKDEIKVSPVGALGDTGSGLFAVIGVLSALRQRDQTGVGLHIDISMLDSMVAFADIVPNYFSLGKNPRTPSLLINHGFKIKAGEIVIQIGREHQFESFAKLLGKSDWLSDERFASRLGWVENIDIIREAVFDWAGEKSLITVCENLAENGVAAAPAFEASDVVNDPHVLAREMLIEVPTGGEHRVLTAGNPVRMTNVPRRTVTPPPPLGFDTQSLLQQELSISRSEYDDLRSEGIVN
ncbi:MAG: CoA transferase [Acidimicrobiaceae bacterium]|nr:CoA transferase [Acidimicrobiaceae bacterium]